MSCSVSSDPMMLPLQGYTQHGSTSTYEHCQSVALMSFYINRRLHLRAREHELIRAALLHDFYLYDWHDASNLHRLHGFRHPHTAALNAKRFFNVTDSEVQSIESHMWPLTLTKIPRHREGWIICIADKLCAIGEIL